MKVYEGKGKAKTNHCLCYECGLKAGSELPISKPHSLIKEVITATHRRRTIQYDRFSYQCEGCGSIHMTEEQCEDLALERELAQMEIDFDLELEVVK